MKNGALFLLVSFFLPAAPQDGGQDQETIRFNHVYSAKAAMEICPDGVLNLKVIPGKSKFFCAIQINDAHLDGYLVRDHQKINEDYFQGLYQFLLPGKRRPMLFLRFYRENEQDKVMILNPDYLSFFKPCFDKKGIELILKNEKTGGK